MDSDRLQYLFERYRTSNCSEDELEELNQWYEKLHAEGELIDDWIRQAGGEDQLTEQLYHNFSEKILARRNKFLFSAKWLSAAAAAVILLGTGLLFYKFRHGFSSDQVDLAQSVILPGTNKAILTLSDGTKISLDDTGNGQVYNKNGLSIIKTDSGSLTYRSYSVQGAVADHQMQYNTLYVPRGGQYRITLPDGTKVWMNSASTLRFPVTSNGRDRFVSLSGEGYFEVAHNKQLPFKVRTADQEIRVLGTHFNVKGYNEEGLISTTLLEGSVQISKLSSGDSKLLLPGQQANTGRGSTGIVLSAVNVDQVIAWKNGYFIFDNQDIQSIMKAISRWYDIDVLYESKLSEDRYGGTFSRHANLSEILDNLQELGNVRFQIKQRKVVVSLGSLTNK